MRTDLTKIKIREPTPPPSPCTADQHLVAIAIAMVKAMKAKAMKAKAKDNDDGTDQPLDVSKELLRVYVSGSNANLFRISSSVVVLVSEYRS